MMAKRTLSRTYRAWETFNAAAALIILLPLLGCPPPKAAEEAEGTYLAARSKMYGDDEAFDIRDTVTYPIPRTEGVTNPSTAVSDQELTMNRCTWCHECGFQRAFDWENYGHEEWAPQYTGEQWAPVLQRMMDKEETMIQEEQIVQRIYEFLRDATLGVYDEEADDRGAVVVELDGPPPEEGEEPGDGHEGHDHGEEEGGGADEAGEIAA